MPERDRGFSPPTTGGASLLTVFVVLCLTVFALLSLSAVRVSSARSDASAKAVEDYYAADCKAQEILARLRSGERPAQVSVEGTIYSWTVPISETQELRVKADVRATDDYTVLYWRAAPIGEEEPGSGPGLRDGEDLPG